MNTDNSESRAFHRCQQNSAYLLDPRRHKYGRNTNTEAVEVKIWVGVRRQHVTAGGRHASGRRHMVPKSACTVIRNEGMFYATVTHKTVETHHARPW